MSVANGRELLNIPGPTNIPDAVLAAMHRPAVDIYSGEMLGITHSLHEDLPKVFRTASAGYSARWNISGARSPRSRIRPVGPLGVVRRWACFSSRLRPAATLGIGGGQRRTGAGPHAKRQRARDARAAPLLMSGRIASSSVVTPERSTR